MFSQNSLVRSYVTDSNATMTSDLKGIVDLKKTKVLCSGFK